MKTSKKYVLAKPTGWLRSDGETTLPLQVVMLYPGSLAAQIRDVICNNQDAALTPDFRKDRWCLRQMGS
jgi:hypothetical protein